VTDACLGAEPIHILDDYRNANVLMDFHLPTMDGLRVVSAYKDLADGGAARTHFIGITADVAGFMARPDSWETFDLVIAKPIDIANLCSAVENFEHYMAWRSHKSTEPGVPHATPVILADDGGSETQVSSATSSAAGPDAQRCEQRVRVDRGTTQITLGNGQVLPCRVLNLSLSGAALEIDERPVIGEQVRVGRTEGRVVRHTREGIAVEFGATNR
jgi:CheY-like chemotaxis protein